MAGFVSTGDGVTPTVFEALVKLSANGPLLAHDLHIFARGRLFKLGLAHKLNLPAPYDGMGGGMLDQLHYAITEGGERYLRTARKGADQ